MSKYKIEPDEKIRTVEGILNGKETQRHAAARLGVAPISVQQWIAIYQSDSSSAFTQRCYKRYPKELKEKAVLEYLNGNDSLLSICQKYGIRAKSKLQDWIKKYNGHEELKTSGTGGATIMTKGRKTTFDERVEIVQYCISHDCNYAETAEKFNGVEKAYAIQAGRELRILVNNEKIPEGDVKELARNIAKQIETDLRYPGRIRLTMIRETRIVEYAR